MAEAREGISGEAAAESSPVVGELQRDGVCQHRRAGQCVLPGEREGHRGEGCGREPGGCEAEDKFAFEGGAGLVCEITQYLIKKMKTKQNEEKPKFISRKSLSIRWEISTMTLRRMQNAGELKPYYFGRDTRYLISEIEDIEKKACGNK